MLVAQGDLQVIDVFTMALETEMTRLDDAGMHRPDRHLVDFSPFYTVVITDAGEHRMAGLPSPGIVPGSQGRVVAHRLEPGVPIQRYTALLRDLPLEQVCLGTGCRDARQTVLHPRTENPHLLVAAGQYAP